MLFTASKRVIVLKMPRPLLGCQIKAEIKGFLLVYCLFLVMVLSEYWKPLDKKCLKRLFPRFSKKNPLLVFNILKEPLLVQKKTVHQPKPLIYALIWHPYSDCIFIINFLRGQRSQEVKKPPRAFKKINKIFFSRRASVAPSRWCHALF